MERKCFSVAEVAEILQTTEPRIRELIRRGHLPAFKLGKLLIRNTDLDNFMSQAVGKDYLHGEPVPLEVSG